ncbi:hypothetical protein C4K01_4476 [Pseudomonas synxantha]|nr:hypothetical protein C4K01_4476 [Pseudomonas synxantha]
MAKVFFRIFMRLDGYAVARPVMGGVSAILGQAQHRFCGTAALCCGASTLGDRGKA